MDRAAVLEVLQVLQILHFVTPGEMLHITIKTTGIYPLKGALDAEKVGNPSLHDLEVAAIHVK